MSGTGFFHFMFFCPSQFRVKMLSTIEFGGESTVYIIRMVYIFCIYNYGRQAIYVTNIFVILFLTHRSV